MSKCILILEDDREAREKLAVLMHKLGHMVLAAATADEANELVRGMTVDIALVDLNLPDVRGEVFATYLHEIQPSSRLIFISGGAGVRQLHRFGSDATFLPKPLDVVELLESLKGAHVAV